MFECRTHKHSRSLLKPVQPAYSKFRLHKTFQIFVLSNESLTLSTAVESENLNADVGGIRILHGDGHDDFGNPRISFSLPNMPNISLEPFSEPFTAAVSV